MGNAMTCLFQFCVTCAVMLLAATSAPAGGAAADTNSVDRFSHAFDDAQFRKDRPALDRMLAKDMVYIRGSGKMVGREAFLDAFADPAEQFEPFVITDRRLVTLGDGVVAVTADGTIRGTNKEGRFEDHFRFTDIFGHRGRGWQVVFVQVSRITGQ